MEKKDLKIGGNEVVHCPTEELANKVLKITHECGYSWGIGQPFTHNNRWFANESNTCYDLIMGGYNDIRTYINYNYKIVPAEEFLRRHEQMSVESHLKAKIKRLKEEIKMFKSIIKKLIATSELKQNNK